LNRIDRGFTGNIIANTGFIERVGFPNAQGVYALNAQYTALWGAMQSLGQMVGMIFLNPISDRIGRKMTLFVLWLILFGVGFDASCLS
jgi:MFS family permease